MALSDLRFAELEILKRYGDIVSAHDTRESVIKFGQNPDVDNGEHTVMNLQGSETSETYASTNAIDRIVSDDDANGQSFVIDGHTIDADNNLTFVSQNVTLDGQTAVALSTPLARTQRAKNNGTNLETSSSVFVYENSDITAGVPDDDTKVHLTIAAIDNQSIKAALSTQFNEYLILSAWYFDVNQITSARVDFRLKTRRLVAGSIPAFRSQIVRSTSGSSTMPIAPHLIIRPNSDLIMTALSSAINTSVSGGFIGYYARPVGR